MAGPSCRFTNPAEVIVFIRAHWDAALKEYILDLPAIPSPPAKGRVMIPWRGRGGSSPLRVSSPTPESGKVRSHQGVWWVSPGDQNATSGPQVVSRCVGRSQCDLSSSTYASSKSTGSFWTRQGVTFLHFAAGDMCFLNLQWTSCYRNPNLRFPLLHTDSALSHFLKRESSYTKGTLELCTSFTNRSQGWGQKSALGFNGPGTSEPSSRPRLWVPGLRPCPRSAQRWVLLPYSSRLLSAASGPSCCPLELSRGFAVVVPTSGELGEREGLASMWQTPERREPTGALIGEADYTLARIIGLKN